LHHYCFSVSWQPIRCLGTAAGPQAVGVCLIVEVKKKQKKNKQAKLTEGATRTLPMHWIFYLGRIHPAAPAHDQHNNHHHSNIATRMRHDIQKLGHHDFIPLDNDDSHATLIPIIINL
jgi:hypothetical protein